ncbi:solute carrier family 35 member F6 [Onthophagus taurus]|uniref:solute carrier family 35 member F6 n=1 Tax=Onthophagus taurus TaxID=166361 RepID=UPI000C208846|nr:solute carrier family 35 member F6 [Onthophagus taurus]
MAWTRYQLMLAFVMVTTGSINSITTKWADLLESKGRDGVVRPFDHPFVQALSMFFGEFLCLVMFNILYKVYSRRRDGSEDVHVLTKGNRHFNRFILLIPAMCDMTATSIMYIGLNLTYVSSFQMLRGSVIIFVALLSVTFLDKVIKRRQWSGIFLIILGLVIVAMTDIIYKDMSGPSFGPNSIITGDLLIVFAQIITSIQMVIEEKFVHGLDIPPLQAVGWEGVFGFLVLGLLQIPFYFIYVGHPFSNNSRGVLEDVIDAFVQINNNPLLLLAILGTILSIAFFNFAGISVTKEMSATHRMVLDSVRTIVIWMISLFLFHQKFHWLQLVGFVSLLIGMFIYNGLTLTMVYVKARSILIGLRYSRVNGEDVKNLAADEPGESSNP